MIVQSESEWANVARDFLDCFPDGGVIGLVGPLGAGKTTFVRALVRALNPDSARILSPSFVIHQSYRLPRPFEHFDLYRLENLDEKGLIEIGYFEALEVAKKESGFVLVEWPEKVSDLNLLQLDAIGQIQMVEGQREWDLQTAPEQRQKTPRDERQAKGEDYLVP